MNPILSQGVTSYAMGKQAIDTLHMIIEGQKMEENIDIPYELVKIENKDAP